MIKEEHSSMLLPGERINCLLVMLWLTMPVGRESFHQF
jgi:hypothetical protein